VIADRLELADWRRQVSELYAAIRADPDPVSAWMRWREVRDRLFRSHPQSPVPAAEGGKTTAPTYYAYDPGLRTVADLEAADGATFELPGSTIGHVTAERAGTAHFSGCDVRRRDLRGGAIPARHREGSGSRDRRRGPSGSGLQLLVPAVLQLRPAVELPTAAARELAHAADPSRGAPPPLIRTARG